MLSRGLNKSKMKTSLYLDDCYNVLRTLSDKSVNLILTDPPYCISKSTNFASGNLTGKDTDRFRVSMDFGDWDYGCNLDFLGEVVKECYRVLVDGGTLICFYDLWKISYLHEILERNKYKQIRFIEWVKTNPVPLNSKINYLTNSREIALTACKKSKPIFHSEYDNGQYHYSICHGDERRHPTQKPLNLLVDLIKKHSNEGDTVLDCFMGSGSTGVAALKCNCNFIGIEKEQKWFDYAEQWIKEVTNERTS